MGGTGSIDWYGDGATTTVEPPPEAAPDPRAFRWPEPAALALFTAAFLLFCAGAWWITHPNAVMGIFGGTGMYPEPLGTVLAVDAGPYYVKADDAPHPTTYPVDSLRVSVDLRGNEDLVRVSWAVCDLAGNGRIGSAIVTGGSGYGDICSSVTPFVQGQAVDLATQQVLLLAEPLTTEPFAIGPATATYRMGLRAQQLEMPGTVEFNAEPDATP